MRVVIQRVSHATIISNGNLTGEIDNGYVVLLGIRRGDEKIEADKLVSKVAKLRIFSDENGKMNKSINDIGGSAIVASNFTLYANCVHGARPDFMESEAPDRANELYEYFVSELRKLIPNVSTGIFGADMKINMVNDGPITIVIDSEKLSGKGH